MRADGGRREAPLWLRTLGASVLAVMAGAVVYAVAIALVNLSSIGV